MARMLSHPFRLAPNGAVATVEQESAAGDAEQIAVLALTVRGERPLTGGFGITDPTFAEAFPAAELASGIAKWGPPVILHNVNARTLDATTQAVEVTYE